MRMTFSLRQLLAFTAFFALTLGGLFWLSRMFGIDPNSEQVIVLGSEQKVQWRVTDWAPGVTGVSMPIQQLTPTHGWTGDGSENIRESLISISYKDHFGNQTYCARVLIDGLHSNDWADYILNPNLLGGGSVDGATRGKAFWDPSGRILAIELTQYINRARIGKMTRMVFRLNNDGIVEFDANTEQSHAPKSPPERY
jgi:hypothetical protein